ncbi:MAG: hypothetical protein Q4B06_01545 [Candidatus Saccharibacteria bacterium]|nr:hypothetical protein [Candidatus Saccharibacteria bacterium]
MPFYEPGEAHPYDGEEANVKIYASTPLTQSERELVSLLYNESRDADLAYQQGKVKTQYLSLFGRIERFIHDKAIFSTLPREDWTQPLYIMKALHCLDDTSAVDPSVTLHIEPLDVLPRWPERSEDGRLIRPGNDASFSLVVDLSVDCWYWVRTLLSGGMPQHSPLASSHVHKEIDAAIHQAHTAAQATKDASLTDRLSGCADTLSSSLDLLYTTSQTTVSSHP